MAYLNGPHREGKAGCRQRARQDLGHRPLLGSAGGVLCGFQAKARLVNLNQNSRFSVTWAGVLSKAQARRRPWKAGENV